MKFFFKKQSLRVASLILCAFITAGSITYFDNHSITKSSAKTIEYIEQEKADNIREIEEIEKKIEKLQKISDTEAEYQEAIQDKIDLQNRNLQLVNEKLEDLHKKIKSNKEKISQLEIDIKNKQKDIDKGMEEFKARLRAMYVSGNDSLASALVGATDFYDMLSKLELISQVSKHDNELIESLKTQLHQLQESQAQLDIEQSELNSNIKEQEDNREEFQEAIDELQTIFNDSKEAQDAAKLELASKQRSKEAIEADNKAKDDEIEIIKDAIARQNEKNNNSQTNNSSPDTSDDNDYNNDNDSSSDNNSNDDYNDDNDNDNSDNDTNDEPSGPSYSGGALAWPVPSSYGVTSEFGYRWGTNHNGIDIAGSSGATITAAEGGTVILVSSGCTHNYPKDGSCGCGGGYGNYVLIDHGNGISTLYGHCTSVFVSSGQYVSRGESIASVGTTGFSTGNHCHFEVRVNGSATNPRNYL